MAFQRKKPAAIGVKAPYPGFIEPALATSIERVPNGERWIHEIKFDGYRVQVHLVNEAVKVFTRRGNDRTKRFNKVAAEAWHIGAGSTLNECQEIGIQLIFVGRRQAVGSTRINLQHRTLDDL
jgi:bifunctional non-homologous end joining protein LigD